MHVISRGGLKRLAEKCETSFESVRHEQATFYKFLHGKTGMYNTMYSERYDYFPQCFCALRQCSRLWTAHGAGRRYGTRSTSIVLMLLRLSIVLG